MNGMILLNTLTRFPVPLITAAFATGIAIYQIHSRVHPAVGWDDPKWVMLFLLALPTSLLAKLWSQSRGQNRALGILFSLAAALIVLFLGFYWMRMGLGHDEFIARLLHLGLVIHLAIAVLPALRLSSHGFWEYNRFAFTRFIAITIFAGVLFTGLAASLASIDYLFKWHVNGGYYFDLFFLCAFLYHPIAFLSKLPEVSSFDALKNEPEKVRPTDTLCQYVAIPLLALYFVILYLYLIRIIFVWELPRGGIGYLASGVGLWGILCFLLLDPAVRHSAKLRGYRTLFFVLLSPMIVLLFVGMSVRVGDYGWTERRYLLAAFGSWLTLITVYFFASRSRDIRFVPITLAIFSLVTLLGPWSAYELPPYLQRKELERLLAGYELFHDGKITPSGRVLSLEERKKIGDLMIYLSKTPQRKEIARWAKEPLAADSSPYKVKDTLLAEMKLIDPPKASEAASFHYFRRQDELLVPVRGFSYVINLEHLPPEFTLETEGTQVILKRKGQAISTFEVKEYLSRLEKMEGNYFDETVVVEGAGKRRAQLRLFWLTGNIKKEIPTLGRLKGYVLLSD